MNIFGFEIKRSREAGIIPTMGASYLGNVVTANTSAQAMQIAAVYRCVNLISDGVASLQLKYKRFDRASSYFKTYDTREGKQLNYLLQVRPNERQHAYTFFKYLVVDLLLRGNALVVPIRDGASVQQLILCSPGSFSYDVNNNTYTVNDPINGIAGTYRAGDILHFKNYCNDGGYWGQSTLSYARTTLSIAATAAEETVKRFATGGRFKAVLGGVGGTKSWGQHEQKQLEGLAEDINEKLKITDIVALPDTGIELKPFSMTSADMQFLQEKSFTIAEIARYFNVPRAKLMDDTNSNYRSNDAAQLAFYAEALQPICTEIEREFHAKFTDASNYDVYKFVFDMSALYTLDLAGKAAWNQSRLNTGLASVNDLRREYDLPPVEHGNDIMMSCNVAPLGSAKLSGEETSNNPTITDGNEL